MADNAVITVNVDEGLGIVADVQQSASITAEVVNGGQGPAGPAGPPGPPGRCDFHCAECAEPRKKRQLEPVSSSSPCCPRSREVGRAQGA